MILLKLLAAGTLLAQIGNLSAVLTVVPPREPVIAKRGATATADVRIRLRSGYHVNSSKPTDPYLIPLSLKWEPGVVEAGEVTFPKPALQKFEFSERPLSVYDGEFTMSSKFKVPAAAPAGLAKLTGKLRYQACNDRMCLPPRSVDVVVPLDIRAR